MEAKEIVCCIPAKNVIPKLTQQVVSMEAKEIICCIPAKNVMAKLTQQETVISMEAKEIVCCIPAKSVIPTHTQQGEKDQESDVDGDVKEITKLEYRHSLAHRGNLIRIEEEKEDIDPLFKRYFRNLQNNALNSTPMKRPKLEKEGPHEATLLEE
ncbi:PREDICTED: uncharacterized protein LOC104790835 isoform X2 [Camelina sativa]|uniref:Uncharacterized protein LOC104790835 isoform X2 n=1 Tax=Camelina sativa TaxID=90675 RepID=A0ABM0ZF85_CAMSA|nr:PREDICTED: uncharacterized protein LOC104790835 isoform X2 [Camelina sativa]